MIETGYIRIWRGWRKAGMARADFVRQLGSVFIPATWQIMKVFGLHAYVPSTLPEHLSPTLPDEVAVLFYRDQASYSASRNAVAGRAYGLLHETVFSFAAPAVSSTTVPVTWDGSLARSALAWRFPAPSGKLGFANDGGEVVFVALVPLDGRPLAAADIVTLISHFATEKLVLVEERYALLWLASATDSEIACFEAAVRVAVQPSAIAALQRAQIPRLDPDFFAKQEALELSGNETLYFSHSHTKA